MKTLPSNDSPLPIQTKDLGRLKHLQNKLKQRQNNDLAAADLQKKIDLLIKESTEISALIKKNLPKIKLNSELPINQMQQEIIQLLQQHQVLILAGETGCGKTTQLPQLCLLAGLGVAGKIAHTQPRRVAATSVANRIAEELGQPIGQSVGYAVRFAEKKSANTRIKLMTDGVLLAEVQRDPLLKEYQVIIIDEAHERSLNIDFLLGFLKNISKQRKDLKVIITSATIDPESFSNYFNGAPIIRVEGRTYPVDVRYLAVQDEIDTDDRKNNRIAVEKRAEIDPLLDKIDQAIAEAVKISTGDILIFSNGEAEIKDISRHLQQQKQANRVVLPFYARLGIKEQQSIFKPHTKRKIIIATNVAETSLTIPNIVFVVDLGRARISRYSHRNKIQQLPIEKISQASAEQRKGRCGRVSAGICFRLYSQTDFEQRPAYTAPEIKRTNLSSVVLKLKSMTVAKVETFPFIDAPDEKQWRAAFTQLFELGATNHEQQLTPIAEQMAKLPLDPQLARILVTREKRLVDETLIIASFLSVRDIRMRPSDRQQKSDQSHTQFIDKASDIMTIVKMWRLLKQHKETLSSSSFRRWCQKNFISFMGWLEWRNIYHQIRGATQQLGIAIVTEEAAASEVHRSLVSGFIGHTLIKTNEAFYQGARGVKVWIHPSSQFFKVRSNWLIATEMVETEKAYARSNFPVETEWLVEQGAHLLKSHYYDPHWSKKKGYVVAFLNQTLLGLPLVVKKMVDYSQYDKKEARDLFLLEGLAKDQLNQDLPFIRHNRELMATIDLDEQKLRNRNIRISDQALVELYSSILPETVNNQKGLNRWLKKNWQERNQSMSFSRAQLIENEVDSIEQYPGQINIRGFNLDLAYQFSPGEINDGVTVTIPEPMVEQFHHSDFDWLVPGYLNQKILGVLKGLEKSIRKQLIPLAETADEVTQAVFKQNYRTLDFSKTLCTIINACKGVAIDPGQLDLNKLDNHLKMKFRLNNDGKFKSKVQLKLGDLIQNRVNEGRGKIRKTVPHHSANKHYSWPDDFVSMLNLRKENGIDIRSFHALVDHTHYVQVEDFPSLESAQQAHNQGLARLLVLHQLRSLKSIKNAWPQRKKLEKFNLRHGGFSCLFEWLALAEALAQVNNVKGSIQSEVEFKLLCAAAKTMPERLAQRLTESEKLVRAHAEIYSKLGAIQADYCQSSLQDIKQQLTQLWQQKHFLSLNDRLDNQYLRYFKGITARLKRIEENYPKERQALSIWRDWLDWWQDLQELPLKEPGPELLNDAFWRLEEYRLSLFAPAIKTQFSISEKKLQKTFEQIEALES